MTNQVLVLLYISFLLLTACSSHSVSSPQIETIDNDLTRDQTISPEKELKDLVEAELATGVYNDKIILDFRLGMHRNQVKQHMQQLLRQQKVVRRKTSKNRNALVYQLPLPKIGKVDVYFDFYYHKQRLYKAVCYPRIPAHKSVEDLLTACAEVFETKYGIPNVIFPAIQSHTCAHYYWVAGNRQIELSCPNKKVTFSYLDARQDQKQLIPDKVDLDDLAI